jgi:hypothetical protein
MGHEASAADCPVEAKVPRHACGRLSAPVFGCTSDGDDAPGSQGDLWLVEQQAAAAARASLFKRAEGGQLDGVTHSGSEPDTQEPAESTRLSLDDALRAIGDEQAEQLLLNALHACHLIHLTYPQSVPPDVVERLLEVLDPLVRENRIQATALWRLSHHLAGQARERYRELRSYPDRAQPTISEVMCVHQRLFGCSPALLDVANVLPSEQDCTEPDDYADSVQRKQVPAMLVSLALSVLYTGDSQSFRDADTH